MTKIIVLGGAGDMASRAVRELAREPAVTAVTVADYDRGAAERLADELGDKVVALWVDANHHASLVEAIRGHDAVASGIGPFYLYEARVARAAIEAGVPYVSLCDDYDAAQAVLELDESARAAGVTVLTGLGWTPGLSNLLARKAAGSFDRVEEIRIAWGSSASDSDGYAVILHTMHIFTGLVPSQQYGWTVQIPAGSGRERVLFPAPLGVVNCYHVGHPEPVTLPRAMPEVNTVTLKGGLVEQPLNDLALALARLGLTNTPAKKESLGRLIKPLLPYLSQVDQPDAPCSGIRVDVSGWTNGQLDQVSYGATAHMADLTGLPLAMGALMLARGEIHAPGVVAPEDCIQPEPFLAELEQRGIRVQDMTGQEPPPEEKAPLSPAEIVLMALAGLIVLRWLLHRQSARRRS